MPDPSRFGTRFTKLWSATAISTVGDGVRETALPLLASTLTRDPILVASVAFAGRLPWLLFTLASGALVDRWDRRRVMWIVDGCRCALMALLAIASLVGIARIPLLVAVAFVLGSGETLFDNASQALLPLLVPRDRLSSANARLEAAFTVGNSFIGPPIGGLLFAAAVSAPFFLDSASFLAAVLLVLSMGGVFRAREATAAPTRLRSEIAEGVRWLWGHRLVRTLAAMLGVTNLALSATFSILVLFALEDLHVGPLGYGLLFAAGAVGGVIGSLVAPRLERRFGPGTALLASVAAGGGAVLVIGLTSDPYVAGAAMAAGGLSGGVWNVITVSLRQAVIPDRLFGRVNSVYRWVGWGTLSIGSLLGGIVADRFGLRWPFYLAAIGLFVMLPLAAPLVNDRTLASALAGETDSP
jgi:MFS family permease